MIKPILRFRGLAVLAAFSLGVSALADQPCTKANCEKAAALIESKRHIAVFCSLCDEDSVKIYEVESATVEDGGADSSVTVRAKLIAKSKTTHKTEVKPDPAEMETVAAGEAKTFGLDLPYTYVQTAGDRFACISTLIGEEDAEYKEPEFTISKNVFED